MHTCAHCLRSFAATAHLKQHQRDTGHSAQCAACGKSFGSVSALQQHQEDTGHGVAGSGGGSTKMNEKQKKEPWRPSPPFEDAVGEWVKTIKFKGKKSFGYFRCKCSSWLSAHAQPAYRQKCKECSRNKYPLFMWVNLQSYEGRSERLNDNNKPHMSELCEACKMGVCSVVPRRSDSSDY